MKRVIIFSKGPIIYVPGFGFVNGPADFLLEDEFIDTCVKLLDVQGYKNAYKIVEVRDVEHTKDVSNNFVDNSIVLDQTGEIENNESESELVNDSVTDDIELYNIDSSLDEVNYTEIVSEDNSFGSDIKVSDKKKKKKKIDED